MRSLVCSVATTITLLAVLCALPTPARADMEADGGTSISYSHRHQLGLQAQTGLGYRVLFPYENDNNAVYCGQAMKSVCTGRAPVFVDLGLSFGVSRSVELLFEMRLGAEADFKQAGATGDRPRAFALQPGVKLYVDDEGSLKFFSTLQLAFDFTDYTVNGAPDKTDFAVHNVNGLQLDLHKTFGVYAFVGETIGFVRWLRFEIDAGVGLQARFP